jgi:hypothetical protein
MAQVGERGAPPAALAPPGAAPAAQAPPPLPLLDLPPPAWDALAAATGRRGRAALRLACRAARERVDAAYAGALALGLRPGRVPPADVARRFPRAVAARVGFPGAPQDAQALLDELALLPDGAWPAVAALLDVPAMPPPLLPLLLRAAPAARALSIGRASCEGFDPAAAAALLQQLSAPPLRGLRTLSLSVPPNAKPGALAGALAPLTALTRLVLEVGSGGGAQQPGGTPPGGGHGRATCCRMQSSATRRARRAAPADLAPRGRRPASRGPRTRGGSRIQINSHQNTLFLPRATG